MNINKRIGILTYHRSHNYGALLQAYGLKYFLKNIGCLSVEFIDYYPEYHYNMYANKPLRFSSMNRKQKIRYPAYYLLDYLRLYRSRERRRMNFNNFIEKYIIEESKDRKCVEYDVVIYGSDQIWRKQRQLTCPGFNEVYFGINDIITEKHVAYAASMGIIDLSQEDKEFITKSLKKFSSISVREKELQDVLNPLLGFKVKHTLDPVFLLTVEDWSQLKNNRLIADRYILFYNLQENHEASRITAKISKETGYKIIEVIGTIRREYERPDVRKYDGPKEFISLVENADFVVTSSFHGVAFSIIFEKQFYACLEKNFQRVQSLLAVLELNDRSIISEQEVDLSKEIDYEKIKFNLERARMQSIEFLLTAID